MCTDETLMWLLRLLYTFTGAPRDKLGADFGGSPDAAIADTVPSAEGFPTPTSARLFAGVAP